MSMFNDTGWTQNGNADVCILNVREGSDYAKEFQRGLWPVVLEMKKMVWNVQLQFRRKMGPANQSDD